ncbi:MAG: hypothetical protein WCO97_07170, partial [bacterium]
VTPVNPTSAYADDPSSLRNRQGAFEEFLEPTDALVPFRPPILLWFFSLPFLRSIFYFFPKTKSPAPLKARGFCEGI